MRHHNNVRKFGRKKNQRKALMKSLAHNLATEGKIKTTEAKAKELRPFMEKLVTLGRKNTLASRRLLKSRVGSETANKIVKDISPVYKSRPGGYTRVTKMVRRNSDGAAMAIIELIK
jgi:large subunit ribosomal protein L17